VTGFEKTDLRVEFQVRRYDGTRMGGSHQGQTAVERAAMSWLNGKEKLETDQSVV